MKIALLQSELVWENVQANLVHFSKQIQAITEHVELIVLPEMFTTGFTMNPANCSETMDGEVMKWMKKIAQERQAAITGSLIIKEQDTYFNRLIFVYPNGEYKFYNKRHLFALAGEDKVYGKGNEKISIDYLGWKICPLICYDLRFPVFSRNVEKFDLLLYVASWPDVRIQAWDILLKARAVENLSYVVGVNRVGEDQNNLFYPEHSQVIDPLGNYLIEPYEKEMCKIVNLDKEKLQEIRSKLNFLDDKDEFTLNL